MKIKIKLKKRITSFIPKKILLNNIWYPTNEQKEDFCKDLEWMKMVKNILLIEENIIQVQFIEGITLFYKI